MKRPRSHELGDLGVNKLIGIFTERGWVCEEIKRDYGEDIFVRIFENGRSTEKYFFAQVKARESLASIKNERGEFRINFSRNHISAWLGHREPVIVFVYDAPSSIFYWQPVQFYVSSLPTKKQNSIRSLIFSPARQLNSQGIEHIGTLVAMVFDRDKIISEGAESLRRALRDNCGIEIEYSVDGVIIVPVGKFIPDSSGDQQMVLFGDLAQKMQYIMKATNQDEEAVLEDSVGHMSRLIEAFSTGAELVIHDFEGNVVKKFSSIDEMIEYKAATSPIG